MGVAGIELCRQRDEGSHGGDAGNGRLAEFAAEECAVVHGQSLHGVCNVFRCCSLHSKGCAKPGKSQKYLVFSSGTHEGVGFYCQALGIFTIGW